MKEGKTMKKQYIKYAIALVGTALLVMPAQAAPTVLYSDNFSGDGTADLHGTTPDTTIGTNTWVASSYIKDDGSAAVDTTKTGSGFLAFTPEANKVYTLSVTLDQPTHIANGGGKWFAMGFANSDETQTNAFQGAGTIDPSPWMLWRSTRDTTLGNDLRMFMGPNTLGGDTLAVDPGLSPAGNHTLSIVLDTTAALWTSDFQLDGVSQWKETFTANPTINQVRIGRNGGVGFNVDTLSLTVVPEPATVGMLGLGAVLTLLVRRFKNRA
jgi:hypothetical protein